MVKDPQGSVAVATPFRLVLVSAGHSRSASAGQTRAGGAVSRTVIRWTQELWFPQVSVALQVRSNTLMVAPGSTGGCGGSGPRGGCSCGGGRAMIFERFPT